MAAARLPFDDPKEAFEVGWGPGLAGGSWLRMRPAAACGADCARGNRSPLNTGPHPTSRAWAVQVQCRPAAVAGRVPDVSHPADRGACRHPAGGVQARAGLHHRQQRRAPHFLQAFCCRRVVLMRGGADASRRGDPAPRGLAGPRAGSSHAAARPPDAPPPPSLQARTRRRFSPRCGTWHGTASPPSWTMPPRTTWRRASRIRPWRRRASAGGGGFSGWVSMGGAGWPMPLYSDGHPTRAPAPVPPQSWRVCTTTRAKSCATDGWRCSSRPSTPRAP